MRGKILFIHDSPDLAEGRAFYIGKKLNCEVVPIDTVNKALKIILHGLNEVDCIVLHKDLGQYSGEIYRGHKNGWVEEIVQAIHETNETVRLGIISGEYPDGLKHVLALKADFYLDTADTVREEQWFLDQLRKGLVTQKEMTKRGLEVSMPSSNPLKER